MKRDFAKLTERMVENARAGIAMEQKILAWKIADQDRQPVISEQKLVRKAG